MLASEKLARVQGNALKRALDNLDKAEAAPRVAAADELRLQAEHKQLKADLDKAVLQGARVQLRAKLELKKSEIERGRKAATPPPPDAAGPDPRADVLRAVVDLRKTAEAVRVQREAAPEKDPEVRDALVELNKGRRDVDRLRVAPDPDANAALEKLEELQKSIGLQEVATRIEDGTSLADVSLKNGVAFGMVVDPKVAGLRLSSALAAAAGVGAMPDAETVSIKLADGRFFPARRAKLGSLRIGPIELAEVPCLILPLEAGDPRPVLGTRSLGTFVAHLDPEGTKLYLARIEADSPREPGLADLPEHPCLRGIAHRECIREA